MAFSVIHSWDCISSCDASGMTWTTEPMVTSAALMGRPGSIARRVPRCQRVCLNFETFQSPPTLPMSGTAMVSGKSARAEMTAPLRTPRRAMPES